MPDLQIQVSYKYPEIFGNSVQAKLKPSMKLSLIR